ncbi:MAG: hypothetical protein PHE24_04435 [Patescibacteria group bacterium]|nr:hypothetical protein [Patescibacteria group bacterium]
MDKDTVNPLKMAGSYLGAFAGLVLFLKGWHIFGWIVPLFGIHLNSLAALDMLGGFIAGYVAHILWRVLSYHTGRATKVKSRKLKVKNPPKADQPRDD